MIRTASIRLPLGLQDWVEDQTRQFLQPEGAPQIDFSRPVGEPALLGPDSVAWQVFRNPVSLFIGGVAAVLLELAEPRVRTGVWEHTSFRSDPAGRLRRTGLAAMATVYAARGTAEAMIASVRDLHERVAGVTERGEDYRASDPELLDWVQATASYGFLQAYIRFVRELGPAERDLFYAESAGPALLYGCAGPPRSEAQMEAKLGAMRPRLEPSPVIFEFLEILRGADILPPLIQPAQGMMIRAAVDILPLWIRQLLGLGQPYGLRPFERLIVRQAGAAADRIRLDTSPAAQASVRLGLAPDYLWKAASASAGMRSPSPG
jgi:uncharacterized protein (DUF2236 family)